MQHPAIAAAHLSGVRECVRLGSPCAARACAALRAACQWRANWRTMSISALRVSSSVTVCLAQ